MTFPHESLMSQPLSPAEETLRLVANLPAPNGLAERVQERLQNSPRTARVLRWPADRSAATWIQSTALRSAAAAAIVCVVAGGGWRIYSRVQPAPTAKVITLPDRAGSGFSAADAMRKPNTLTGPVLTHALVPPAQVKPAAPAKSQAKAGHVTPGTKKKAAAHRVPAL